VRAGAATRRTLLIGIGAAPLAVASAAAAAPRSDVEILERLLELEHRLAAAYEAALRRGVLDEELAASLRDQEREHARGLEQTLSARGRSPGPGPGRNRGLAAALRGRRSFARYALDLEGRALRAYVDAESSLRDTRLLRPLGAIMTNEAQHQVALRAALGEPLLGV
jgi:rubrerythrin